MYVGAAVIVVEVDRKTMSRVEEWKGTLVSGR